MNSLTGIINFYKETGYTSSDAVSVVRKTLGCKAGHTGTLDPQAVGVLPILIGKATKIADYIGGAKSYRAELQLGITTDTDDLTGTILSERPVNVSIDILRHAVLSFLGETLQTPPMYSAVKLGGKKLYELARAGKTVERVPRAVTISQLNVIDYNPDTHKAIMDVTCSKGTYIRTICHDIGTELGCGAVMSSLRRTRAGAYTIDMASRLDQIVEAISSGDIGVIIKPVDSIFAEYPQVTLGYAETQKCKNGAPNKPLEIQDGKHRFYGPDNEFLALGEVISGEIKILKRFFEV